DAPECDPAVLDAGIPVLGICYGMQWIAKMLGGKVEPAGRREYGRADFAADAAGAGEPFRGFPGKIRIGTNRGDYVVALPPGFRTTGKTENAIAAIQNTEKRIHAVQFHPEVNHTEQGTAILRNFLFEVCKAEPKWSGLAFVEETVPAIRS